MKTWKQITAEIADIEERIAANEKEKFKLRNERDRIVTQTGCGHSIELHYIIASIPQQFGCYKCDRIDAETYRANTNVKGE